MCSQTAWWSSLSAVQPQSGSTGHSCCCDLRRVSTVIGLSSRAVHRRPRLGRVLLATLEAGIVVVDDARDVRE